MKIVRRDRSFLFLLFILVAAFQVYPQAGAVAASGKTPVIIIPGLTGSELVNAKTGEEVWFKPSRAKEDDIRLPISPNLSANRDNLVPRDIIRSIKLLKFLPQSEIYERLIDALEKRGGYKEGLWETPPKDGFQDTFYVFAYDWRLDNVSNARLLIRKIETLKRRLRKPNLKFNIVAHSMGGLLARYAAMYGNADIPSGNIRPTWAGARHFDKIVLLGTPNEGSVSTLDAFLNGFSYIGRGVNLPFIQDISRFDVFTIPSMYQLLPHEGTLLAYDEKLDPIQLDLFDPATWEKYGWNIWDDKDFTKKLTSAEQAKAKAYFRAVLARAKRFQAALDANTSEKVPVKFYLMGAGCKETGSAMLLLFDPKKNKWTASFKSDGFTRSDGTKVTAEQVKPLIFTDGDSVVTKRSLSADALIRGGKKVVLPISAELYQCEAHSQLVTNPVIQDKLFLLLNDQLTP
ncbi:MAG: hypothetical protein ABI539_08690 [Acidobacteriota bacterium]